MTGLRLDELWRLLPPLAELRPIHDLLLARSAPDPRHTWSVSGELETAGSRIVRRGISEGEAAELARMTAARTAAVYRHLASVLTALADDDRPAATAALLEIAAVEEEAHRPERAQAWARSAFLVSRDERDQRPAALALRRWGRAARARGLLGEALERYRDSYEISRALDDPRAAAEAAVGAGNVLEDQARWPEAERWYRRALRILDEQGADDAAERWHALLNLHITLRSRGRLDEARPLLEQAAEAAEGDDGAIPFLENARGQMRQVEGDHAAAEAHFATALAAAGGPAAKVAIGVNLAECILAQDRHLDAADAARRAEAVALSAGLVSTLPEVYRILGRIAAERGNPDAFVLFERALEIARDRDLPEVERARTLQAYAEAEARRGESETARELHEDAQRLYRNVGIAHPRDEWSEFFAPRPGHDYGEHDPPSDDSDEHAP